MASLNPAEIEQFHAQGYLVPGFRLPAARMDHLRATLDQLIRDNPGVRPEKLVSADVVGQGSTGKNDEGVKGSKDFLDLAMEPEILDMVAQLIGPDIILWGCHVFCKPAGDGHETPWHKLERSKLDRYNVRTKLRISLSPAGANSAASSAASV